MTSGPFAFLRLAKNDVPVIPADTGAITDPGVPTNNPTPRLVCTILLWLGLGVAHPVFVSAATAPVVTDSPPPAVHRSPIPVIFDTDIGSDIDDTWALAQILRSPELDPKLILTTTGDQTYRAAIAARLLAMAGRTDIPIGMGVNSKPMQPFQRNQDPWIKGFELSTYQGQIVADGVGRLIQIVEASPVTVTIIAVGPSSNLAAALTRAPGIASRCRLVGMFGSFDVGYSGGLPASAETNVRVDPAALRQVLAAPWHDVLLTPLDTCNAAVLAGENYHRIWSATDDPLLRAVIENYCLFAPRVSWMQCDFFAVRSTILFDCVAVYLASAEDLVRIEPVRFRITDEGFTVRDEAAGEFRARVALHWENLRGFEDHLTTRLLNRTTPVARSAR